MTVFGPLPITKMDSDIYDSFIGITEGLKKQFGTEDFNTIFVDKEKLNFSYKGFKTEKNLSEIDSKIKDLIIYMIDELYKD